MSTRFINEPSDGVSRQWLSTLETLINPERLKEFNATYNKITPIWNGEERGQELYVVWKIAKDRAVTLSRADPLDNPTKEQTEANKDVQNPMATPISCSTESASPSTSQTSNNQVRATENSPPRQEKLVQTISPGTSKDDVPTPSKKYLLWPGTPTKKQTAGKIPKVNCHQ